MPRRLLARRALVPSLLLVAAAGACVPGGAPRVAPRGTLEPGRDGAGERDTGPFAVVMAVPTGQQREVPEVSITFSRPLRALDAAVPPPPVKMTPQPPGTWEWVGSRALRFSPEKTLPAATSFTVDVTGARALDGTVLEPYHFEFATPRPRVVATSPADGSRGLRPDTTMRLTFNQPVDDAGVRAAVTLHAVGGPALPYDVRRPAAGDLRQVELVPRAPLAVHTAYQVTVAAELRGTEGPLEAGRATIHDFHTYDALSARIDCDSDRGRCRPGGGFTIQMNNPVRRSDLRRAVTIEPAVKLDWQGVGDRTMTTSQWVEGAFLPGRRYTVRVRPSPGLRDEHGQPLVREEVRSFEMADLPPAFHVGVQSGVLEPSEVREVPLSAMNLAAAAEVSAVPLDLATIVALEGESHTAQRDRIFAAANARKITVRSIAGKNRVHRQTMRIDDLLPGRRGPLAIAARWTVDGRDRMQIARVQVTDLGLSAKVGPQESLVWVTRLSSGQPVAGVEVAIFAPGDTKPAGTVKTDAQGLAKLPAVRSSAITSDRPASALIVARDGADWAVHRTEDALSDWRYGAQHEESDKPPTLGLLFPERGVYRPGDVVKLKGVARQGTARGLKTPAGQTAHVLVRGPEGDTVSEFDAALSPFGSFAHDVTLPPGSKLGSYSVQASLGARPAANQAAHGDDEEPSSSEPWSSSFEVAEYRAAEFKAAAETDRTSYRPGDEVMCTGQGTYLFGAPMAGSSAQMRVTYASTSFTPPGLDGFSTSDASYQSERDARSPHGGLLHEGTEKLDAQGKAQTKARLDLPAPSLPALVMCESEIVDLSRQTFAAAASAVVHPGELYAALKRPDSYLAEVGAPLRAEVLAVQPDGTRRAGVAATVELIERRYELAKRAAGEGDAHTSVTVVDRVAASCKVTTAAAAQGCELRPTQAGHHLVRVTVTDAAGHQASASQSYYAISGLDSVKGGGWSDRDDGSLRLVADRTSYRPGQTARVLIQSPFKEAEALVTVEREGVLWQKVVPVRGPAPTVEVPVTEAFLPNVHVSVLLVRGRTKASPADDHAADMGAPTFRMGYVPISVDTTSRKLAVAVKPTRPEMHPGEEVSVDLDVRDSNGKGARTEVTLYAVDEGVLALTGYRTPDPLSIFFASRGVQLHTLDARADLARIARRDSGVALGLDKGLDGGSGGTTARRDFRQTAYFNPSIVTDDQGHARVSFKLPEGLTTYRLMAVAAASDDRFGSAESRVVTSQPLMARPALPRQLRAGDRMEAGVVVTSKGPSGRFDVALAAQGLAIEGESRRAISLATGQSEEVRFVATAPHAGPVKLRFDVQGEGARDAVEVSREVRSPTIIEAAAVSGDTTTAAGEKLGELAALRDDVGGLEISLAPTALAGLAGGVEQLIEYPYGCTEQLTSRLVPLLPLRDLASALGLKLPDRVDEAVRTTVGKVLQNQHADGSFGLWPESESGYPWLTAYALWGLGEAQRRGVPVRPSAIRAATRSLHESLAHPGHGLRDLTERAFVLDVLADLGEPDPAALGKLFEQREQLSVAGQAQLLHALAVAKLDRSMIDSLTAALTNGVRLDGNRAFVTEDVRELDDLLVSPTRTTAMALRALVAARPDHPLAPKLAVGLLAARRGGQWRNTQETAWSLLALDAYRRAQETTAPAFDARVFLGQAVLAETRFEGMSKLAVQSHTPMSALRKAGGEILAFAKDGPGHLFYEARLRFARQTPPTTPIERGLFVERSSRVITPAGMAEALRSRTRGLTTSLTAGDMVLVDLTVVAPSDRQFVVLDDPLPAGLEAVDTSLRGASSWAERADASPVSDDRDDEDGEDSHWWRWDAPVTRRELRDDRVLFFVDHLDAGVHHYRYLARATTIGTFQAPPARMEEMYTPETYGQTAAAVVTVAPKP